MERREDLGFPALHPPWMGWPVGWTDIRPLETGKFQSWLLAHSLPYALRDKYLDPDAARLMAQEIARLSLREDAPDEDG